MVAFLEQENLTQQYLGNLSHNIFHGLKTSCRNVALCLLCPLQRIKKLPRLILFLVTQLRTVCARKQQIYVQNSMEKLNGEIPVNK